MRGVRDGALAAANVFGAQLYLLEQLGFRRLVDTTFVMGFMVAPGAGETDLDKYCRALQRAQSELDLEPEPYKHYWLHEMPADLREEVDVRRFGPGERVVSAPYTKEMFDRTHRWMERWDLFDASTAVRPAYEDAVLV